MYAVVSFSYKHLEIALREQIALPQDKMQEFYASLKAEISEIEECIVLSTCNRFELIMALERWDEALLVRIVQWVAGYQGVSYESLKNGAMLFGGKEAIGHIFEVASSLDSLVVGETQITGQLKSAYKFSYENGFCHKELTRLIHFAFKCAAMIRTQTQISKNAISISSIAVSQLMLLCGDTPKKALVIGAGEMGRLCVRHLLAHQFEVKLIVRHLENAREFVESLDTPSISVASFGDLQSDLCDYPYVFTATGAQNAIITKAMIAPSALDRIWFDLALPRDIEGSREELQGKGISLYVIDDLQELMNANMQKRQGELLEAHKIIKHQIQEFEIWLKGLEVEPLIKSFREKARTCCVGEVDRAIQKGYLQEEERENVIRILHNAFNKFLHHPTIYIKSIQEKPEGDFILENVKKLFDLGEQNTTQMSYKCEKDQ
ncbi:glutamyl-tRNA reductase [Helicobacter enhydrae]|uniref:Glutamyl-tRNA reductase n=1 Tax=Helicobacter enhydrae TaxID=222136 RepID=A0A1B1U3Z5_9HELI|nr:glutamyl-tRNA reductase [Helicobacter enhydrae]ANV97483.1 glutamyl-tRNA reductase [Helicobacter enhydrae]